MIIQVLDPSMGSTVKDGCNGPSCRPCQTFPIPENMNKKNGLWKKILSQISILLQLCNNYSNYKDKG